MPNLPQRETGPLHSALRQTLYATYCEQQPLRRLSRTFSPIEFVRFLSYINLHTIKAVVHATLRRRLPSLASEMAYNAMLGLFPGILAMITAIGPRSSETRAPLSGQRLTYLLYICGGGSQASRKTC